jgi:hypothetical protein
MVMKKLVLGLVIGLGMVSCSKDVIVPQDPTMIELGVDNGYELVTPLPELDTVWIDVRDYTTHDLKTQITIVDAFGEVKYQDSVENKLPNNRAHMFAMIEKGDRMLFGWNKMAFLDKAIREDLQYISVIVKYDGVVFAVHFNKETNDPFIQFN